MKNYLRRVLQFAFRGFAIRTDVWYALVSIAVSALTGAGDKPVSEITTHDIAWYFLTALGVYLTLRLVAAPYYLWKEDQAEINRLREEADWPNRYETESSLKYRLELRNELSEKLAKFITMAEFSTVPETMELFYGTRSDEISTTRIRINEIISALSYDVSLRVTCINLRGLCEKIMLASVRGEETSGLLARLWTQRKLTFRLLQRTDEVNDLVTMTEIAILIEEWGESFDAKGPPPEGYEDANEAMNELKLSVKAAGPNLHLVGRKPNLGSIDSTEALNQKNRRKLTPS